MKINPPSIVSQLQVSRFSQELSAVESGAAFLLSVVAPSQTADATAGVREQLEILARLAAQASYQLGTRIVKVANIGGGDSRHLDLDETFQSVGNNANLLYSWVRDDLVSLDTLESWATTGFPDTDTYHEAIRHVENALTFAKSLGASNAQPTQLDLWLEYTTTPFRFADQLLMSGPSQYLLAGHLIRVTPPAIEWNDEESAIAVRSASPIAIQIEIGTLEFAEHLVRQMATGRSRQVVLRFDPANTSGTTAGSGAVHSLVSQLAPVCPSAIVGCSITDATTPNDVADMFDGLRSLGLRLGAIEVQLGERSGGSANVASNLIRRLSI